MTCHVSIIDQYMYRYIQLVLVLFIIIFITLFIQHHVELDDSHIDQVDGKKALMEEYDRYFYRYFINVRLSDNIPLNRELPDSRPERCKDYNRTSHMSVSIVITFYDEWPSILLRTLYSVVDRTQNLKQIILVDDGNNDNKYEDVFQHLRQTFGSIIQVVQLKVRLGLIGARLEGVKYVTGDVLCFLDSDMEVNKDWLTPLLNVLEEKPMAVAMSELDTINHGTFQYEFSRTHRTRYGFDWNLQFFETEYRQAQLKHDDLILPGVVAEGSTFAIRTDFLKKIGMYDPGLKTWGGENLELSFKVWMCGGELVHVTCSRVGNIGRILPHLQNNRTAIEMFNYKRIAQVWMDQYAIYVYDRYPGMKKMHVGDLRQQFKVRKQCKPFTWFLDNVWPELLLDYKANIHSGSLKNILSKRHVCLDNGNRKQRLTVKPCLKDFTSQMFEITHDGHFRTHLQCVTVYKEVFDLVPYIQNCTSLPSNLFIYTQNEEIIYKKMGLCLTIIADHLIFIKCKGTRNQKWTFEKNKDNRSWQENLYAYPCL